MEWGSTRAGELFTGGKRWQAEVQGDRLILWVDSQPKVTIHFYPSALHPSVNGHDVGHLPLPFPDRGGEVSSLGRWNSERASRQMCGLPAS